MGLLDTSTLFLQLWGFYPHEDNKSNLKKTFYKFYSHFMVIWVIVFEVSLLLGFINLIFEKKSFGRLSNNFSILIGVLLMFINTIIFNQKKVAYLCQDIMIYEKTHLLIATDPEMSLIYQTVLKKNKYLNIFTLLTSFGAMLAFFGMPLLLVYNTGPTFWESDTPFMYELYLPFDRRNYYWFLIITQACVMDGLMLWVTGIAYIACQTTFYGLFMYGTLRFQILQIELDKLSSYKEEDSFERLRSLDQRIEEILFTTIFVTVIFAEVYFLGWTCNGIQDQSLRVAESIYAIQWCDKGKYFKVMVEMMMMRAQKPSNIKIGPLGVMNIDTILSTVKTAYSFITLILNLR
ncbi:hypothetical protein ABEB36_012653 [Hypothenemus hampei]|uniref:Odorant receptor n=1 Tax=Hypothenemus hampei TaxID=57062 RepID=A0ABD1EE08_HYPHA